MTLEELQTLLEKKAEAIDEPDDPSLGFVLVLVKLNPDGSAHLVNGTTMDQGDALQALSRAYDMIRERPSVHGKALKMPVVPS